MLAVGITIEPRGALLRCLWDISAQEKSDGQSFTTLSTYRALQNMLLQPFSLARLTRIGPPPGRLSTGLMRFNAYGS